MTSVCIIYACLCVCREGKTPRTRDGKTLKWKCSLPPPPHISSISRLGIYTAGILYFGKVVTLPSAVVELILGFELLTLKKLKCLPNVSKYFDFIQEILTGLMVYNAS